MKLSRGKITAIIIAIIILIVVVAIFFIYWEPHYF
jgi:hypothetical protein